jgi:hypothetical protein
VPTWPDYFEPGTDVTILESMDGFGMVMSKKVYHFDST